jgi:hypothetical protein
MKTIAISLLLLAIVPTQARAFDTSYNNDVLSYVAMPLAVSSVCDVPGVQTDRVGQLVAYMDQANVAPADFVDVFRYVPVALVMRTDRRPDFVEWTHQQVVDGVYGTELVTVMERQLRTYDSYVPVSTYRTSRRRVSYDYRYAYQSAFEDAYVPVVIRRHCERLLVDPLSLIEMPVAVADVYDVGGIPYDRVSSLVVELNLGDVSPVQFVEVMRYAPVAVVQPDFVQFVRTERIGGITGYGLVGAIDQRLRTYNVAPQIDLAPPAYYGRTDYYPTVANYVAPVDPGFVPQIVQSQIAAVPVGSVAAPAQVERLLSAPNGQAVVVNPAQARRELARANRAAREGAMVVAPPPVASAPVFAASRGDRGRRQAAAPVQTFTPNETRGNGRQRQFSAPPAAPIMASPARGRGRRDASPAMVAPSATPQPREHGNGRGNGQQRHMAAAPGAVQPAPVQAAPPPETFHSRGGGNGNGQERRRAAAPVAVPQPAPVQAAPPPEAFHGRGGGNGNGHGRDHGGPPAAVAAPAPPAPAAAPPAAQPPGREKNKGKEKHHEQ